VLYPALVVAGTVATANHFLADALAAGVVAGLSAVLVLRVRPSLSRRSRPSPAAARLVRRPAAPAPGTRS